MAKNTYPNTSLQPLQTLDFNLANGLSMRVVLKPLPDPTGTHVAHVDLDHTNAGGTRLYPVGNQNHARTVFEAGELAYLIAQHEAQQAGGTAIVEMCLEGEEFLEKTDLEQISGNVIPVKVV